MGLLLSLAFLVLSFLYAAPPVVEAQCAITSATIRIGDNPQFLNRDALIFVTEGVTTGAQATSVTWRINGSMITNGGGYFIGGGDTVQGNPPCESQMYRVALGVTGYLPGSYTYTVDNGNTPDPGVTSPVLSVQDPGPPTNIVLSQISNRRVQATWTAPADASGATYRVYINTMDVNTGGTAVTGTTYTTGSFTVDFGVTLRIRATTGTYYSVPAMSELFTVRDVLPPVITTSDVTATSATVAASQPANSLPVDMYTVTLTGTTCNGVPMRTGTTMTDSVAIGSLEAGIQYSVTVVGRNNVAELEGTGTSTLTTSETAPSGSPDAPTSTATTSTSITITWTEISCLDRNGVITGYTIRYGPVNTQPTTINHTSTDRTRAISGLSPFTNYTVSVRGVNSAGFGGYSAEAIIRTAEGAPAAVGNLRGVAMLFSVVLTWSEPVPLNGILSMYTIRYSVNGSSEMTSTTRDTTFSIADLNPNTVVSAIGVMATTGGGDGPSTSLNDITTLDKPPPVENIVVETVSTTSVRVSWDRVPVEITDYVVYYSLISTRKRQGEEMMVVPSTETSVIIEGLVSEATYSFEVVARVTDGSKSVSGDRAGPGPFVLTTAPPPVPQGGGSPVAAIAGGIIAALAVVVLVIFIIFMIFLYKTGRLCFGSGSPKSGSASISAYRYARNNDKEVHEVEDEHFYGNVDVNFPPQVEEFPENTTAIEGEEVIFKVVVSGKPTPTLTWRSAGKELFSNYALTVRDDGTLTFPSSEMDQSGVYVLEARNSAGKTEREVKLHIEREKDEADVNPGKESLTISAVPVDQFGEYVAENHSSNNRGFRDQFQGLYDGEDKTKTVGLSAEFKKLNRFANITVYDDNRIDLAPIPGHDDCQGTFINACYIDGFSKPKKFIASQGPLPKTLVDFWRMIWQERPPIIVMVTNLKEGNKNKCQQYWPDTGSSTYGPFKVMITENVILADFVIRTLQVMLEGSNRPFKLTQFHFTAWPDHGVPDYASPMLAFHRRILTAHKGKKGPILVHCSAGVGRTGTIICIDNILDQIKTENMVDIAGAITKIRHQRMKMVQTPDQYIFLHDAILESVRCGDTQITAANLRVILHKYSKPDPQSGITVYQSQFDVLDQVSPKASEVVCNSASKNPEKNRSKTYLPSDKFRVIIKGEAEDYIHASFAHGYKQQKAYIIAENPMASTIPNMLKVLYNRKIGAVVMLSALEENGQEACARYWPNLNQVTRIGDFEVDLISEEVLSGFTIRNISILHGKTRKAHQVMQFHITCWQPDGQCSSLRSVVDTIEEVAKVQRKTGNRPIFVHCSDTVTRSGMFCALATIIDRCKTEGVVDVFQVVKALRIQKPGAVPTVNNYKIIFEATLTFLDSFDTYANFQN